MGVPMQGHLRFDPAEIEAMRRTTSAQLTAARSALATGSTGVPPPLTLDPSITLTDTGSVEARSGPSHR